MTTKTLALLSLLLTSIIWGISLPLLKVTLISVPPFSLAFIRFFIASLLALSFSQAKGLKLVDFAKIGIFALFGITLNISLIFIALKEASVVDLSILIALAPIVTISLAVIFTNEKINRVHRAGIILSFLGASIYFVLPFFSSNTGEKINLKADLIIFLSIVSLSFYTIGIKKLFSHYKVTQISSASFIVGAASFLLPAAGELVANPKWYLSLTWFNIFSILFIGVVSSFLAYTLLEWGLSKLPIHVNSVVSYLSPVIAITASALFLNEKLTWLLLISAPLIAFGIFLGTYSKHHHHARIHKI